MCRAMSLCTMTWARRSKGPPVGVNAGNEAQAGLVFAARDSEGKTASSQRLRHCCQPTGDSSAPMHAAPRPTMVLSLFQSSPCGLKAPENTV